MTKAQDKAVQQERELRNPITRRPPNSFTQVTNRELPAPSNVREQTPLPAADRRRLRGLHREATAPGGPAGAVTGYGQTGGMPDRAHAWATGAHHMFPNAAAENNEPAINEPHAAHPGVTVQRRAEDLSGNEYRKAGALLANYGHDPRNPVRSLEDVQRQTLHRVIGEHAAAGVEENASQHFYGGGWPHSDIPDPAMRATHEEGVLAAHGRFLEGVDNVARHPDFVAATAHMSHRERTSAATNLMAQATADTSPNSRWRQGEKWPNLNQAEESATAGVEGRTPDFVTGRIQNVYKATRRVGDMMEGIDDAGKPTERFAPHVYGNPRQAAKTVAFRGALIDPNAADAYKVSDVHEASNVLPGTYPGKALHYRDSAGKRVAHYPDQPASHVRGLTPEINEKTSKHDRGNARTEDMLRNGSGTVHALNDYATRRVLAEHGLSRGTNYADNVHTAQAATWGSQQVRRTDKQMADVSHADQYPVVRDWAAEGHADIHPDYRHMFPGQRGMGPQFVVNPNTSGVRNPARRAYPLQPEIGEKKP
jgi:hypothetical protein